MSAPARAWLTACSARSGSVASLSTSIRPPISASGPQWPWSVYSQKHRSVITSRSGATRLAIRIASWTMPSSRERGRAACVLVLGDAEEEDRRDAQLGRLRRRLRRAGRARAGTGPASTGSRAAGSCRDRRTADRSGRRRPDAFRGPGREAGDGRGAGGADAADNRRRAGRSSRDSHGCEGRGWSRLERPTGAGHRAASRTA